VRQRSGEAWREPFAERKPRGPNDGTVVPPPLLARADEGIELLTKLSSPQLSAMAQSGHFKRG
jgi:hypothetical protein